MLGLGARSASGRRSTSSASSFRGSATTPASTTAPSASRKRAGGTVPAEFLERLRHDDGPARARRHRQRGLVSRLQYLEEILLMTRQRFWRPLRRAAAIVTSGLRRRRRSDRLAHLGWTAAVRRPAVAGGHDHDHGGGVSPRVVTVAAGARVTFVNNDTAARHGVGPASGSHRLSGSQRGLPAGWPKRSTPEPQHGPDVRLPRPQSAIRTPRCRARSEFIRLGHPLVGGW